MMTLRQIDAGNVQIPLTASWYLSDIGRAIGMQELFRRQAPQKLQILRENAVIESAISSNRIEGVEIDQKRVRAVVIGKGTLSDGNEQEVRGYQDALRWIHEENRGIAINTATIRKLHRLCRSDVSDAGEFKTQPVDIIERLPNGDQRVRFRSVSPSDTPAFLDETLRLWNDMHRDQRISPLLLLGALNLDFLCVHPFRDGNGRVSRLLFLLSCYHAGIEVGRYISLERTIEQNKERYYETLQLSSQRWHEGKHDPWPCINYLLFILNQAYREFEERLGQIKSPRGAKRELVLAAIRHQVGAFRVSDLQDECPGVGLDLIRLVLKELRKQGMVKCLGRGQNAEWEVQS